MSEEGATQPGDDRETGTCEECGSEIPRSIDRCPECGYEPSLLGVWTHRAFKSSIVLFNLLVGLIIIAWAMVFVLGRPFGDGVFATAVLGTLMLIPGGVVFFLGRRRRRTPTGHVRSWDEMADGGKRTETPSWMESDDNR